MLKQIQQDFKISILDRSNDAIVQHIRLNNIAPEFRLGIYRNTVVHNLCRALELTFPIIWKLVGKECADNLARAFIHAQENLPITNCLDDWGAGFPEFLKNFQPIAHLSYLKDVAQVEWLKHLSYCAADYKPLNPDELKKYWDNQLDHLQIILNPTLFLYSAPYSLSEIFELMENSDTGKQLDLKSKASYALICRPENQVNIFWVNEDLYRFLENIQQQKLLLTAFENTVITFPEFDLLAALQFILLNGFFWQCVTAIPFSHSHT